MDNLAKENLSRQNVVIVDYENFQCIPSNLLDKKSIYYLFCGKSTMKKATSYVGCLPSYNIKIMCAKHVGRNFVDNKISAFIGYLFGKFKPKSVTLVSNDIDYYEMLGFMQENGFPLKIQEPSLKPEDVIKRQKEYLDWNDSCDDEDLKKDTNTPSVENIKKESIEEFEMKPVNGYLPTSEEIKAIIKANSGKLDIKNNDLIHIVRSGLGYKKKEANKYVEALIENKKLVKCGTMGKKGAMQIYKLIHL